MTIIKQAVTITELRAARDECERQFQTKQNELIAAFAEIEQLRAEIGKLRHQKTMADISFAFVECERNQLESWKILATQHLQQQHDKIAELRTQKFARFNNEDCWIYQGDGNDNLASLVCPVVIAPATLAKMEAAQTWQESITKTLREFVDRVGPRWFLEQGWAEPLELLNPLQPFNGRVCQHDLQKPDCSVIVADSDHAHCGVCLEDWILPQPLAGKPSQLLVDVIELLDLNDAIEKQCLSEHGWTQQEIAQHAKNVDDRKLLLHSLRAHCSALTRRRYSIMTLIRSGCAVRDAIAAEVANNHVLTFDEFRVANKTRCLKWHPAGIESWSPSDWMTAVTGELGELASLLKMRNRERDGLPGNKFSPSQKHIADELADVLTYLDLLAETLGVDLGKAAIEKFNEVSARVGFPDRLPLTTRGEQ